MEVGPHHDGLCDSLATDITEACYGVGYSGPTHQVGTFSCRADDLYTGEILQVVYTGDSTVAWSASLHSILLGSLVYSSVLEDFPKVHGDTAVDEYRFHPQTDCDTPNFRGSFSFFLVISALSAMTNFSEIM